MGPEESPDIVIIYPDGSEVATDDWNDVEVAIIEIESGGDE